VFDTARGQRAISARAAKPRGINRSHVDVRPGGGLVAVLLVTNDDGIHAAGLAALAQALEDLGEVHVLAPEREQSACGHALTLHRPLRVHRWGERRHAVNGTPSDCVNLGVLGFLPERPVLIVSGINHGSNLGDDVTYSGTVSAAMEGTLLGVPSIAVSLLEDGDFAAAGRIARQVAMRVLVEGLPPKTLLNVNVPTGAPKGVRVTRLGHRVYSGKVVEQADPRGRAHYWIGAGPPAWEALDGTDMGAVHEGYAAVTPLHLDLTHHRALAQMADWASALNAALRARSAAPAGAKPAAGARPEKRKSRRR
jgi:5'-nucleotidase